MHFAIQVLLLVGVISKASAECANACSGSGKCGTFDMCYCEKGYGGNDCSHRSCAVGNAHVDTPKGDLNGDNVISNADVIVVINSHDFPYGTQEAGVRAQDTDLNIQTNTGHEYVKCSNKGTCNLESGLCECMPGYVGDACQRADCPNNCNNKGKCKNIEQIAKIHGNVYKLWDKETTMGCVCDPGYSGPDCSSRKCKFGVDPLYFDDVSTQKLTVMKMFIGTTRNGTYTSDKLFNDGTVAQQDGTFRLAYTDKFGETLTTSKLTDDATCDDIVLALEQLPNDVIHSGDVFCSEFRVHNNSLGNLTTNKWDQVWEDTIHTEEALAAGLMGHERYNNIEFFNLDLFSAQQGHEWLNQNFPQRIRNFNTEEYLDHRLDGRMYELAFMLPGDIPELRIELYTDGASPTLVASNGDPRLINRGDPGAVIAEVWSDGEIGEDNDYFADHCDGVVVHIDAVNGRLIINTALEVTKLKMCVADADNDWTNQPTIDNFDHGNVNNLHMVKIVKSNTYSRDGGFYLVIKWDSTSGYFLIINNFTPPEWAATGLDGQYEIFTTEGILELVSSDTDVIASVGKKDIVTMNFAYENRTNASTGLSQWSGDLSCEVTSSDVVGKFGTFIRAPFSPSMGTSMCLSPGDIIVFLNPYFRRANTNKINMYTVEALTQRIAISSFRSDGYEGKQASGIGLNIITLTHASNFGHVPAEEMNDEEMMFIYKFTPAAASTYEVVAPCSNRGTCHETSGLCDCFKGYSGLACDLQSVVTC